MRQCPASSSSNRPKTDGPSNRGKHSQSIDPSRVTSAAEWQSESRAWSPIGTELMTRPFLGPSRHSPDGSPGVTSAERAYPPGAAPELPGFEGDERLAGVERVRRAGHGLDRDRPARARRGEGVPGEDLHPPERLVH